ncbi:protocadherin gamma-C5 isoform X24 [Balaenoptera acutorostrata]|uniref:Protocadherin gamma-C5 isoform X24 n=1 Tax=Balaenoptera acutorostrata TaxID=9767 RepID=A0ABM3T649_BALAC|nr:protocadherin gamma-C5 isoform X24 [Balaenoptera acutorostrata]
MGPKTPPQLAGKWQVLCMLSLCSWGWVSGQLRYSVVEESEPGTLVGNVAQDLGLKLTDLLSRRLRLGSEESGHYFSLSLMSGALAVNQKIDRESLCGTSTSCLLPLQVVTEHPLELIRVEVEILDLNDNSPSFATPEREIRISESAALGALFPLDSAQDPDVGTNTVSFYTLSPSSHFSLNVKTLKDGKLFPELVLEQQLDREAQARHQLVLTAVDGGIPPRSGTTLISITVLDINDNAPTFQSSVLRVGLPENAPVGTLLLRLNATDPDEGTNGQLDYSFGDHTSEAVRNLFGLDPSSGAIYVLGPIDFEESSFYEIHARARDQGQPAMEGHCVIQVDVGDANDNAPEVSSDGTLKYMEVTLRPTDSHSHCYRTCFSPASDGSDFTFLRPLSVQQPSALAQEPDAFRSRSNTLQERSQQAPPNTDWRFSQAQRPGTSGSQNGDETGTWPNNQFDTEMLQAMILASASEAADGSSTLGGGAGTMGLSARYGPQFTLQHVPDYRQNVYIPGSNATLTNAAGKRDGKAPAGGNGNKKKSGKKEKK